MGWNWSGHGLGDATKDEPHLRAGVPQAFGGPADQVLQVKSRRRGSWKTDPWLFVVLARTKPTRCSPKDSP